MEIDKNKVYYSVEGFPFKLAKMTSKLTCVVFAFKQGFMKGVRIDKINNVSFLINGKGYFDVTTVEEYCNKRNSKAYQIWTNILCRIGVSGYKDVSVCKEWLLFSRFEEFHNRWYQEGYAIDKDLLSGNTKIYSPSTCTYMPGYLNNSITPEFSKREYDFKKHNGVYYYDITDIKQRIYSATIEGIIHKYAIYRCIRVKTYYSLCWKFLRPEAREKIENMYQVEHLEKWIKGHLKED